jgi:hypothetical protein
VLLCLALSTPTACGRDSDLEASAKQAEPEPKPEPTPSEARPATDPTAVTPSSPSAKPSTEASATPEPAAGAKLPKPELPSEQLAAAKDGYELLATGAEPRQTLRFAPKPGQVETIKLTMTMKMAITGPGMPPVDQNLPPIEQINRAETLSVEGGRIEEKIVLESFSVAGSDSSPMTTLLRESMAQIEGFEQVMIYDDRGGVIDGELSIPEDAGPQLASTLETMGKTFEQVLVRLPEPAVGVGAKWRETSKFDNKGIELEQTSQFELVAREGERVTLDTQVSQRPLSERFSPPNMPGEVKLLDFDSKGAGRVVYELGELMPESVETRIETDFTIEAQAMGQTQKLTTHIEIELALERVE